MSEIMPLHLLLSDQKMLYKLAALQYLQSGDNVGLRIKWDNKYVKEWMAYQRLLVNVIMIYNTIYWNNKLQNGGTE